MRKIKNDKSVVLTMTKSRYNWRKSKAIFEVFRTIYLNPPEIAVKDIAKQLGGKAISSISDQLRDIREEKLVIARIEGRDKYYRINHKKFNKDVEKTNLALFTSFNFEQFFSFEKPGCSITPHFILSFG